MSNVVERFLGYTKIDTQSDEESTSSPSSEKEFVLARMLKDEMEKIGLVDVSMDEFGYVMGTLPSNMKKEVPSIGFIAHMDTSPDMSGKDVCAKIVKNYDGKDIILNEKLNIVLSPKDFPELNNYVGQDLITSDGTTLLGADDKAGVSEILTAMETLIAHPELPHGTIRVGFTPDEEVGRGPEHFDVKKFNTKLAYTVDGGALGELECENFNAAGGKVIIQGRNVHPGSAKGKMVNSIEIASEFINMLPKNEKPEYTEGYEGFYHVMGINGDVEKSTFNFIVRDFEKDNFEKRKQFMLTTAEYLNNKYGKNVVTVDMKDQYKNMKEKIEDAKYVVDTAFKAMELAGVKPKVTPIRGGTDGATISFMGIPTPNMFTGGENFHGKYEYASIQSMEKAVDVILKIVELYANN